MDDYRWSLMFRFLILNLFGFGLVVLGLMTGFVQSVYLADQTVMTSIITGVFIILLAVIGVRLFTISNQLNLCDKRSEKSHSKWNQHRQKLKTAQEAARPDINQALYIKLVGRLGGIAWAAGLLTLLGLIGTVLGIQMSVSGVDPTAAGDVNQVPQIVGAMVSGIGVALSTTLVGGILNIWAYLNYLLLAGGATRLYTKILEANSDV